MAPLILQSLPQASGGSGHLFLPTIPELDEKVNCSYIRSDISQYPYKITPHGEVYYSPRYRDDRYVYRHVLLSKGASEAAEALAEKYPHGLLTEEQFVKQLGIDLSPGWEHFMRFKGRLRELILRRPLPDEENDDGIPKEGDEISHESDDSDVETLASSQDPARTINKKSTTQSTSLSLSVKRPRTISKIAESETQSTDSSQSKSATISTTD